MRIRSSPRAPGISVTTTVRASADGQRLLIPGWTGEPESAPILIRTGRPRVFFEFVERDLPLRGSPVRRYDVAPDGERFYAVALQTVQAPPLVTHINLIQNWFEELKAKVPAGGAGE